MTKNAEVMTESNRWMSEATVPRTSSVGGCPLCGETAASVLFRGSDRLHETPGEFTYRRCASCSTVFQDPRIINDDLHLIYPSEYVTHNSKDPSTSVPPTPSRPLSSFRNSLRRSVVEAVLGERKPGGLARVGRWLAANRYVRERAFHNYVPDVMLPFKPGRLRALEIGCGSGKLLSCLSEVGWDVEGVEVDPIAAQIARRVSGQPVWDGDFRKASLPARSYYLIVLHHVFEHLDDPISVLRLARELLAPGGRLVIFYPNPFALGARTYGSDWLAWDVPRHLVLPPGKELARHARRAGLIAIQLRSTARGAGGVIALSRAHKEGKPVVVGVYDLTLADRALAFLEAVLVRLGFFVGEEIRIVFEASEDEEVIETAR